MRLHCLRSPYDFFRRQTITKLYRDLVDIVRPPQGYRTIIVLSSRPLYMNRTMAVRWPCGSRKESVPWLRQCRVIMCMDLNGYPCSFQSHVITNRAMKRLDVRTSHTFSLRDPYISFLEVILKFKSQNYKSHKKKYLDFLLILSNLSNPLSNQHFIYWKFICISR